MNGADWRTPWGHLIDHGEIQITVQRHGQGAGYRRRGHDERIRVFAFRHELHPLDDAEAMLFINDDQTQPLEYRVLFDKSMSSNDNLNFAGCNPLQYCLLLG